MSATKIDALLDRIQEERFRQLVEEMIGRTRILPQISRQRLITLRKPIGKEEFQNLNDVAARAIAAGFSITAKEDSAVCFIEVNICSNISDAPLQLNRTFEIPEKPATRYDCGRAAFNLPTRSPKLQHIHDSDMVDLSAEAKGHVYRFPFPSPHDAHQAPDRQPTEIYADDVSADELAALRRTADFDRFPTASLNVIVRDETRIAAADQPVNKDKEETPAAAPSADDSKVE